MVAIIHWYVILLNQNNERDRQVLLQMENYLKELSSPIIDNMPDGYIKRMLQTGLMQLVTDDSLILDEDSTIIQ